VHQKSQLSHENHPLILWRKVLTYVISRLDYNIIQYLNVGRCIIGDKLIITRAVIHVYVLTFDLNDKQ